MQIDRSPFFAAACTFAPEQAAVPVDGLLWAEPAASSQAHVWSATRVVGDWIGRISPNRMSHDFYERGYSKRTARVTKQAALHAVGLPD